MYVPYVCVCVCTGIYVSGQFTKTPQTKLPKILSALSELCQKEEKNSVFKIFFPILDQIQLHCYSVDKQIFTNRQQSAESKQIHSNTAAGIHTYIHTHIQTHIHTYKHTYTHKYSPTHTHTHTHVFTYTHSCKNTTS